MDRKWIALALGAFVFAFCAGAAFQHWRWLREGERILATAQAEFVDFRCWAEGQEKVCRWRLKEGASP